MTSAEVAQDASQAIYNPTTAGTAGSIPSPSTPWNITTDVGSPRYRFQLDRFSGADALATGTTFTNWRIEIDVGASSGEVKISPTVTFDSHVYFEGTAAYGPTDFTPGTFFDVTAPGTYSVDMTNLLYSGAWPNGYDAMSVLQAAGDTTGTTPTGVTYNHAYGELDVFYDPAGHACTVTAVRFIWFTAETSFVYAGLMETTPATRLYPRDDNRGISATNRIYPPPRANRIIGGQP